MNEKEMFCLGLLIIAAILCVVLMYRERYMRRWWCEQSITLMTYTLNRIYVLNGEKQKVRSYDIPRDALLIERENYYALLEKEFSTFRIGERK